MKFRIGVVRFYLTNILPNSWRSCFVAIVVWDVIVWTCLRISNENVFRDCAARSIGIAEIT